MYFKIKSGGCFQLMAALQSSSIQLTTLQWPLGEKPSSHVLLTILRDTRLRGSGPTARRSLPSTTTWSPTTSGWPSRIMVTTRGNFTSRTFKETTQGTTCAKSTQNQWSVKLECLRWLRPRIFSTMRPPTTQSPWKEQAQLWSARPGMTKGTFHP